MTESKTWNTLERDYRERLEAARPYVTVLRSYSME